MALAPIWITVPKAGAGAPIVWIRDQYFYATVHLGERQRWLLMFLALFERLHWVIMVSPVFLIKWSTVWALGFGLFVLSVPGKANEEQSGGVGISFVIGHFCFSSSSMVLIARCIKSATSGTMKPGLLTIVPSRTFTKASEQDQRIRFWFRISSKTPLWIMLVKTSPTNGKKKYLMRSAVAWFPVVKTLLLVSLTRTLNFSRRAASEPIYFQLHKGLHLFPSYRKGCANCLHGRATDLLFAASGMLYVIGYIIRFCSPNIWPRSACHRIGVIAGDSRITIDDRPKGRTVRSKWAPRLLPFKIKSGMLQSSWLDFLVGVLHSSTATQCERFQPATLTNTILSGYRPAISRLKDLFKATADKHRKK